MVESKNFYGANTAVLSAFPDAVRPTLHLLQKNASGDEAQTLLDCLASAMQPDYVCSLQMLSALPHEYRIAALEMITQTLTGGFSSQEKAAILAYIEPIIASRFGGSFAR